MKHIRQTIGWFLPEGSRRISTQLVLYLLGCVLFSLGVKSFIDASLGTDPLPYLFTKVIGDWLAGHSA